MTAIWKRELQAYFYTPVGYVYMGVFLALSSGFFIVQMLAQRSTDLVSFVGLMSYLWMLLCPVLTMRLLSEERQKKTDQLLLTSPVSLTGMVVGKYFILQGCAFVAVDLLCSALTRSPVAAAVTALGVNFALWMMDLVTDSVPQWLSGALSFVSLYARNEPFLMAQLSFASCLYDLTVTFTSLALIVWLFDRRRR